MQSITFTDALQRKRNSICSVLLHFSQPPRSPLRYHVALPPPSLLCAVSFCQGSDSTQLKQHNAKHSGSNAYDADYCLVLRFVFCVHRFEAEHSSRLSQMMFSYFSPVSPKNCGIYLNSLHFTSFKI
jgi:hypothetical protein